MYRPLFQRCLTLRISNLIAHKDQQTTRGMCENCCLLDLWLLSRGPFKAHLTTPSSPSTPPSPSLTHPLQLSTMNANRSRSSHPWGFTRPTSPATDAGHSDRPHKLTGGDPFMSPLGTLNDPSEVYTETYLIDTRCILRSTLPAPPGSRQPLHRPGKHLPKVFPQITFDTDSVPSKRARDYTPSPSTLYRDSPVPPFRIQRFSSCSHLRNG